MNQAMSNNANYFKGFYQDLENHRFSLIVCDRCGFNIRAIRTILARKTMPGLNGLQNYPAYYEPLKTLDTAGIQLLTPRLDVGLLY